MLLGTLSRNPGEESARWPTRDAKASLDSMAGGLMRACTPSVRNGLCSEARTSLQLRPFCSGRAVAHRSRALVHRSSRQQSATTALFGFLKKPKPASKVVLRETIEPTPSYNIPIALTGIAGLSALQGNAVAAGLAGVLGVFLAIQASRVRFRFDDEALEVLIGKSEDKTENAFVGGENRWKYDTFVNWEYWWPSFPVLVYFKIHFFPIIFDGKQLYEVMAERCGESQNSGKR